jgi:hypothetical protein
MNMVKKIARYYMLGIDAVIRLIGTCLIVGLMIAALGVVLNAMNWLFFGQFSNGPLHAWIGLILLPPILRLGILAGGFTIPPLWNPSGRPGITKRDDNKPDSAAGSLSGGAL